MSVPLPLPLRLDGGVHPPATVNVSNIAVITRRTGRFDHPRRVRLDRHVEEARLRRRLVVQVVDRVVRRPGFAAEVVLQPFGGLLFAGLLFHVEVEGAFREGVLAIERGLRGLNTCGS